MGNHNNFIKVFTFNYRTTFSSSKTTSLLSSSVDLLNMSTIILINVDCTVNSDLCIVISNLIKVINRFRHYTTRASIGILAF